MFLHIYINRLKCIIRDKQMMFWTLLFPILLATLFGMAFSNLSKAESFDKINIGVVDNEAYQKELGFQSALASVSDLKGSPSGEELFKVSLLSEQQAENSLKDKKIAGYILFNQGPTVVVKESGLNQTILKTFLDDYLKTGSALHTLVSQHPENQQSIFASAANYKEYVKEVSPTKAAPDNVLVYYYALIAMACIYGSFLGMNEVTAVQANQSSQGARINLAPVHKLKLFGYSLCAAITVHLSSVLLLLVYMGVVLKVSLGNQLGYILLATLVSSVTGISFGAMIGAVVKKGEGVKVAIQIGASMVLSFLSGLMVADIKYAIASSFPLLSYLNPVNLTADAFYALYYYSTYTRYFMNVGLLLCFAAVFYLIVYFVMRRQKYANI